MRAWITIAAAALLAVGVGSPRVAGRSGQVLLVAIGLIVAVVAVQPVFSAIEHRRAEAFIPHPPRTPRATMPNQMAEIVDAFTNRGKTRGEPDLVSPQLVRRITAAATGRLVDHHHLHLADEASHDEIRRLVSPTLWELVHPDESATTPAAPPALLFDDLERLLDELERL